MHGLKMELVPLRWQGPPHSYDISKSLMCSLGYPWRKTPKIYYPVS